MSKTVSTAQQAKYDAEVQRRAMCWKIKQQDGTIFGFTNHTKDLDIDVSDGDGEVTYQAALGFGASAVEGSVQLNVDNMEVETALGSGGITAEAIRAGDFDFAEVKVFEVVDYNDLDAGVVKLRMGVVGEQTIRTAVGANAEIRGLMQHLANYIGEVTTPDCRADFGDTDRCKFPVDPSTWTASTAVTAVSARDTNTGDFVKPTSFNDRHFKCTTSGTTGGSEPSWDTTIGNTTSDGTAVWTTIRAGTITDGVVATVTDNRTFTITSATDAPDDELPLGILEWLTGNNANKKTVVKTWDLSSKTITTFLKATRDVQVGDTFTVKRGCNKTVARCAELDNFLNFRGEPLTPIRDKILVTPDANV